MNTPQGLHISDVVADLTRQGAQLWIDNNRLRIRAPKGILKSELCGNLAGRRSELLEYLSHQALSLAPDVAAPLISSKRISHANEPFPLTATQQVYYAGRERHSDTGNVSCHVYYEIETDNIDLHRLNQAWQRLIERHDMLRVVFLSNRQQQILAQVPFYEIHLEDLSGLAETGLAQSLDSVRQRMSHQVLSADRWPLFEICASKLTDQRMILHFSFDLLIMDAVSLQMLFKEWQAIYHNPQANLTPLNYSFREYVMAEDESRQSQAFRRATAYWTERLSKIPLAPELPLRLSPDSIRMPQFTRRCARIEAPAWQQLKERAASYGFTPSVILLTAFSEIIAIWSKGRSFSINVTLVNRRAFHPQVNRVIGDFTSFLPLAVEPTATDSFELLAGTLQGQLCEDIEHRDFNGVEIGREMMRRRDDKSDYYFPVVFTSLLGQSQGHEKSSDPFWLGKVRYGLSQTPQVWLDHQVIEQHGALVFHWDAIEDLFPEEMLNAMFEAYVKLLHRLIDDPQFWKQPRPCLTPPAQIDQRDAINNILSPIPDILLDELFYDQVRHAPDRTAVVAPGRTLTYRELQSLVSSLAIKLRYLGAQPNQLIAVVMEKGWEQIAAVLGVMQAGAAYLPISADLPTTRLREMLADAQVQIVLTQSWIDEKIELPATCTKIFVDQEDDPQLLASPLPRVQSQDDLAYVIYTSGSTGKPKGVMISHRAAVNTILDINRRFGVQSGDRVIALSSLSFDLSVYDIFGTLAAGATLVIPDPQTKNNPVRLADLVRAEQITIWNSVPALMEMLVEYEESHSGRLPDSLRLVLLSGDWIPVNLPSRIAQVSNHAQVISLGGATEASIWSISHPIKEIFADARSVPYGKPLTNQSFHVLDRFFNPCPIWVPGQLYIGGDGLAHGYWQDEDKTKKSFIIHPRTKERLYKTGDLGCYLPNGEIEFLGREDTQVKIRGYRIELGEIESVLLQFSQISSAAVVAVGSSSVDTRLVAYLVSNAGYIHDPGELRAYLKQRLPEYMIPADLVFVESLPLTANGKVDRRSLITAGPCSRRQPSLRLSDLAAQIEIIVADVLHQASIEPNQDLFSLGADSLDLITIASRLEQEFGIRPRIAEMYQNSTISGMIDSYQNQVLQGV